MIDQGGETLKEKSKTSNHFLFMSGWFFVSLRPQKGVSGSGIG